MSGQDRDLEEFFEKLMEETDDLPVECFKLKDRNARCQGVFLIDRHLEESKKGILSSTIDQLSDAHQPQNDRRTEGEQSCAVSTEERTLLFNFPDPSNRED